MNAYDHIVASPTSVSPIATAHCASIAATSGFISRLAN